MVRPARLPLCCRSTVARDERARAAGARAHTSLLIDARTAGPMRTTSHRTIPFAVSHLPRACCRRCCRTQPNEPRALWASNRVCEAAVRHRKQEQHLANLRNVHHALALRL